jgi:hypothetical protein
MKKKLIPFGAVLGSLLLVTATGVAALGATHCCKIEVVRTGQTKYQESAES